MTKYIGCLLLAVSLLAQPTLAAVPAKAAKPKISKILNERGSMHGGVAGNGFTLLDVRVSKNPKKKMERVVLDVGDRNGKPQKGSPGFYYAELQKKNNRLILDFSQMPNSRVNQKKLAAVMKKSNAVKSSRMTLDPIDNALNLSLELKKNTKVRVYQVAGKQVAGKKSTSKVVIDFITE